MCEGWLRGWVKKKQTLTFRELLNHPTGDTRRQAPQVEGNGCELNYLEWDGGFCRGRGGKGRGEGGDPCVGGGPAFMPLKTDAL